MDNTGEKEACMLTPRLTRLALPHLSGYSPDSAERTSLQPPSSTVGNMNHRCVLASMSFGLQFAS